MRIALNLSLSTLALVALVGSCSTPEVSGGSSGNGPGNGPGGGGPGGGSGSNPRGTEISLPEAGSAPPPPDAAAVQCAAEAHKAEQVPLDLLLLLDSSGSMSSSAGMLSKWVTAQNALRAFVTDPRSEGLGIGLQFFPQDKQCNSTDDCTGLGLIFGFGRCEARRICAGAGGPAPDASGCSSGGGTVVISPGGGTSAGAGGCPMATTCQITGQCATSKAFCTNRGQECPNGGGMCGEAPKYCSLTDPDEACQPGLYQQPAVPISPMPAGRAHLVRNLMAKQPNGGTPMAPAVAGVIEHLRAHQAANPGRKAVLVLASDGLPSPCGDADDDIPAIEASLRAAFTQAPAIGTYVIGVFNPRELMTAKVTLDRLAVAGGSNEAIVLTATDDLTRRLQDALNQIRGAALACEYQIPTAMSGRLDFAKVNLRYTTGAGQESLPYVERADRCDATRGGWYYDVAPGSGTPTKVVVCPATCQRFKGDTKAQVELVFGCATETIR